MLRIPLAMALALSLIGPSGADEAGGITWYGTWAEGRAAAERSGRPILLLSAAPQCHNISGLW